MKYLGVIIDHKLKWCEHISYVKNTVSRVIRLLDFQSKNGIRPKCLITHYNSFVYPCLIYFIEI